MKNNITSSLIILGNGFDLNCGLKSKFSDFFKTKKLEIKNASDTYTNSVCSNIWYLLLYFAYFDNFYYDGESKRFVERIKNDDPLWMNVEGFIKKIVATSKEDNDWMNRHLPIASQNYCGYLYRIFISRENSYVIGERNQISSLKKHFNFYFNNSVTINIYDYLYEELLKFEEDFKNYLVTQINNSKNYKSNYDLLLSKITKEKKEFFSIISFNYTGFLGNAGSEAFLKDFYNIHGSLSNNIIIGFDSSDIGEKYYNSIKMCKAWQKMNSLESQYQLPKRENIDTIKFYGHSLGKQDYSYFHAMFDYYDIYNSTIKLVFYYTEYGKKEKENQEIRNTFITQVYSLLNDYAIKSGNESIVRTIVSRLQLENRLFIYPIEKLENEKQL